MRAQFLVVIAIGLLSGGDPPKEDKGKADRDALKGTWNVVFQKPDALPRVVIEKLIFKGDKLTWHSSLQEQRSSVVTKIKLDPSTEPKEIDFTPTSGGAKGQTYLGIYEIKEDILKICY